MAIDKIPDGFTDRVKELILSGANYKDTDTELKTQFGGTGIKGSEYNKAKQKLFPDEKVAKGIEKAKEKKEKKKKDDEKNRAASKKTFDSKAQKAADETTLAKVLNKGLFIAVPCPSKQLNEEELQNINLGGAIVGVLQYYLPEWNPDHPVIILVIRLVLVFVKVKEACFNIKKKIETGLHSIIGGEPPNG